MQYDMTPSLKRAIEEWGITAGYLGQVAAFDRVLVYMIPSQDSEYKDGKLVYKGTSLEVLDTVKDKMFKTAPRGVIISAGLRALGQLRTNGFDIGHTVVYLRLSPYRPPVGLDGNRLCHLNSIRTADLMFSEDTGKLLQAGKIHRAWREYPDWRGYVYETDPKYAADPEANFIIPGPPEELPSYEDM